MILLASLHSDEWTAWSEHVDDFIGPRTKATLECLTPPDYPSSPEMVSHYVDNKADFELLARLMLERKR